MNKTALPLTLAPLSASSSSHKKVIFGTKQPIFPVCPFNILLFGAFVYFLYNIEKPIKIGCETHNASMHHKNAIKVSYRQHKSYYVNYVHVIKPFSKEAQKKNHENIQKILCFFPIIPFLPALVMCFVREVNEKKTQANQGEGEKFVCPFPVLTLRVHM